MTIAFGLLRRILNACLLLAIVVALNFTLIHAAPGDPAEVIAGEMGGATAEILAEIRARYGLDQPFTVQLMAYFGRIIQGDFGYSFYFNEPVLSLILQRLPATLLLVTAALGLSVIVGVVMGVISARRPRHIFSHIVTAISLAGYSAPVFWTGLMLLLLFASLWPIFPTSGMSRVAASYGPFGYVLDVAHHLILPAATLAIVYVAQYSRLSRTAMIDALDADYVRTARAKGLGEGRVVFKHALRNALIPVVTVVGLQFGQLFAGAVLVETVYAWPGMGRLVYESILRRDYPTLLGVLFFSAVLVMVVNILTDLVYRLIDPRIRTGG